MSPKLPLYLVAMLASLMLSGQSPFNADYPLPDGVYLSHASLLATQPDLGWEAIDGEMVQLPEEFKVQIGGYGYKDERMNGNILPYAISLDGQPYLFVRKNQARDYYEFSGLRVAGTISVITYDTTVQTRQLMKAYNPANGQPFREAWVEREKTLPLTKVWHLRSGALMMLTRENLTTLLSDDKELTTALADLPEPTKDLLLRAVKLYDDRYPTILPLIDPEE